MIVVGTAVWTNDTDTNDTIVSLVTETATELAVPEVKLVSILPPPRFGEASIATLSFANPFAARPLTEVEVLVEAPSLTKGPERFQCPGLDAGADYQLEVEIIPRDLHSGSQKLPMLLVATVVSKEIEGIYGKFVVEPM